jgi:hypothetical protein
LLRILFHKKYIYLKNSADASFCKRMTAQTAQIIVLQVNLFLYIFLWKLLKVVLVRGCCMICLPKQSLFFVGQKKSEQSESVSLCYCGIVQYTVQ